MFGKLQIIWLSFIIQYSEEPRHHTLILKSTLVPLHSEGIWGLMIAWVTVGHLGVTVGHFRATAGHLRVIKGPLRVRN